MKVFRIEHTTLVTTKGHPAGPYSEETYGVAEHEGEDCDMWTCMDYDHGHHYIEGICGIVNYRRPSPDTDGIGEYLHEDMLFCFQSLDMLYAWFDKDIEMLRYLGFTIVTYDVPKVATRHGFAQSIFDWNKAKNRQELPL